MQEYEKLGAFYLGRPFDVATQRLRDEPLLYDAKDLTTHGLCVGMTGSGKTGLCLSLMEEAALDGIPVLAIDPKGDLGNLLLAFPDLTPADFLPWVDPQAAARQGMTTEALARRTAEQWRTGLAEWGQEPGRIQRFKDAADVAVYTPGSSAGLELSVLRSFAAPPPAVSGDPDALRDRIEGAVSGLLALLGIQADPVRSREHILLSTLFADAWGQGRDLDLPALIRAIQRPPFDKVGVFDLESFYSGADRFELAMAANHLLASPGFAGWLEGDPLDIPPLLFGPDGRPRISILSIAHLRENERMFVVTLVLNEFLSWTRSQAGTSSLRALLYMDEIFGYFPPTANPPAKRPLLTLLKQARAYGVGVMLATQNPVDLDYKGLSNTGTWFLGRLQTDRDKQRVLDGLEGVAAGTAAGFDRARMDALLSGLGSRRFLMHNVHEDQPVVFQSRWAMSYLRGPLTRRDLEVLMEARKAARRPSPESTPGGSAPAEAAPAPVEPPVVPAAIPQFVLPRTGAVGNRDHLLYRPRLLGTVRLHYVRAAADIDVWQDLTVLVPVPTDPAQVAWDEAAMIPHPPPALDAEPEDGATYAELPAPGLHADHYAPWQKGLIQYVYQHRTRTIHRCRELKAYSRFGETEGEFRARLRHALHERRDLGIETIRRRYGSRLATVQDRLRRAEARLERERAQLDQAKLNAAISVGATVLSAFFGRKLASHRNISRATTAMRGVGRTSKEEQDMALAREEIHAQHQRLLELEQEMEQALDEQEQRFDPRTIALEPVVLRPRKSDLAVDRFGLAWEPWRVGPDGQAERLGGLG